MSQAPTPLTAGNARVKEARKLSRRSVRTERRLFLADGPKAVAAAAQTSDRLVEVFATPAATDEYDDLAAAVRADGVPWTLVDDRALGSLSDAVTPAGLVGVCVHLHLPLADVLNPPSLSVESPLVVGRDSPRGDLVAICADVRDPGNAGTIVRTADAAGVDGVVLAGNSVDPYNPKTVRATAGSLFHLPLALAPDPVAAVHQARSAGLTVLAADGAGEVDLDVADDLLDEPTAWLFGNEAWGLPAELAAAADHRVRIPIHGRAESLNLAVAAALCLYASANARRAGRAPSMGSGTSG